jgi:hypothetical protein
LSRSAPACAAALAAIARFHRCTGRQQRIDAELLDLWVGQPVERLRQLEVSQVAALDRLERELRGTFVGRLVHVSWIHGDFWAGNVLLGTDAAVSGIVDWDLAAPDELPLHDLLQLVISGAARPASGELGAVVRARLTPAGWTDIERRLLERVDDSFWNPFDTRRGALLLYWLRFVTTYLTKQPAAATSAWWMAENVRTVLEAL